MNSNCLEEVSDFTDLRLSSKTLPFLQTPTASNGSPGYPHFCPTWLQSQGIPQPSYRVDHLLGWFTKLLNTFAYIFPVYHKRYYKGIIMSLLRQLKLNCHMERYDALGLKGGSRAGASITKKLGYIALPASGSVHQLKSFPPDSLVFYVINLQPPHSYCRNGCKIPSFSSWFDMMTSPHPEAIQNPTKGDSNKRHPPRNSKGFSSPVSGARVKEQIFEQKMLLTPLHSENYRSFKP